MPRTSERLVNYKLCFPIRFVMPNLSVREGCNYRLMRVKIKTGTKDIKNFSMSLLTLTSDKVTKISSYSIIKISLRRELSKLTSLYHSLF